MLNHTQGHGPRGLSSRCVGDREAPPDPRLLRVIDFIGDRLGEGLSLSDLATVAGLSPNHFARVFKRTFGMAPHRYLVEQRIARACELLGDPGRSLVEVSYTVGFSSQSHLNMVFRRYLRTTPAGYRQRILCSLQLGPLGGTAPVLRPSGGSSPSGGKDRSTRPKPSPARRATMPQAA